LSGDSSSGHEQAIVVAGLDLILHNLIPFLKAAELVKEWSKSLKCERAIAHAVGTSA
jgi:hypothetical protein